jgi:diguanylate cyclase (GGDEF)-like protein/PAS domain S-box-containing protein
MAGKSEEKYKQKTKLQLIKEMKALQTQVAELKKALSESRWAEDVLRQGELVAAATIEGMPDGVMLVNMKGEIIYINKAFERLLGYKASELMGRSALELPTYTRSKDRNKAREYLTHLIKANKENTPTPIDMSALTKSGDEIPINFTASVIRDSEGKPKTLIAVIRDISERKRAEEALRDSEELSRGMLEAATTGIYLLQDGQFQYVNRLFERISGYTSKELTGKYSLDYVHPEDRETVRTKAIEVLKGQSSAPYEFRLMTKAGEIVWVSDRVASIQYKGKRSVLGTITDITERKKAEEEIRLYTKQIETLFNIGATVSQTLNLEELLANVLDKVMEALDVDASGIFLLHEKSNKLILRAYRGMSTKLAQVLKALDVEDEFIGQVAKSGKPLIMGDFSTDHRLAKTRARLEKFQSFAAVPVMAKEKILGVMGVGSHSYREFPDWEVKMLETIANQIGMATENAQLYERALELAFTDGLTGLYNRRYLIEQIEHEFRRAERSKTPLSLIMVDLDGLKTINDRFGHHQGDIFLKEVGRIIRVNTRASDVAARWGGDEFMLLAPETDSSRSVKIAERIRTQVERYRLNIDGHEVGITISVGIVSYPSHAARISELIKNVDEAMYNAKKGGKNRACIFSS